MVREEVGSSQFPWDHMAQGSLQGAWEGKGERGGGEGLSFPVLGF